jgi:hypothetical protein
VLGKSEALMNGIFCAISIDSSDDPQNISELIRVNREFD